MSGIYIHIPFCKQRCYYCDFHFTTSLKNKSLIINTIIKELETRKKEVNETVETIYFGGGTPSVLETSDINLILDSIYTNYNVSEEPEITFEANPDDLSIEKIAELKKTPINRFSVGIQSFHQKDLDFMNRAHDKTQAYNCIIELQKAGFKNITVDLIYGIPNQTKEEWQYNLDKVFELKIPHISAYALTVEQNTPLNKLISTGKYPSVSDEKAFEDFNILVSETNKQGFIQYEISNFGKQDYFSKHNSSYWQGKRYLGVGPSAHSYDKKSRRWNVSNNKLYLDNFENNTYFETEELSILDKMNETLMTGLRTIWGVDIHVFEMEFGKDYTFELLKKTQVLIENNLLEIENNTIKVTKKGKFKTDGITSDLFFT